MSYQRKYNENLDTKSRSQEQSRGAQSQKSVSGKPPLKEDSNNYVGFLEDKLNVSNKNILKVETFEKNLHILVSQIEKMRNQWDTTDDRLYKIENKVGSFEREVDNFVQQGNRDRLVQEVVESLSRGFWGEFRKDLKAELKSELKAEMTSVGGLCYNPDNSPTGRMGGMRGSSNPKEENRLSDHYVPRKGDTANNANPKLKHSSSDLNINFIKDEILCESKVMLNKIEENTNNKLSAMMEELQDIVTADEFDDLSKKFQKLESMLLEEMKYMKNYIDNALINVNSLLNNEKNNTNFTGLNTNNSLLLHSNIDQKMKLDEEVSNRSKSLPFNKESHSMKERGSEKKVRMHINDRIECLGQQSDEYSKTQDIPKSHVSGSLKPNLQKKAFSNTERSDEEKNEDGQHFKKAVENKLKKDWNLNYDSDDNTTFFDDEVKILFENYEGNQKNNMIEPFEPKSGEKNKENMIKIWNNKKLRSKSNGSSAFSEISHDTKTRIHEKKEKLVNQTHNSIREKLPQSDRISVKSLNRTRNKSKSVKQNNKELKRSKSKNIQKFKKKDDLIGNNLKKDKEATELDKANAYKKKKLDRKNKIGNQLRK